MLEYIFCFFIGVVTTLFFNYVTAIGHSITVLKQTQRSCAALFVVREQGLLQVLHLKYLAMEEADRSKQNIIAQKYIDQINIDSIKKSIMKNYVATFPSSYQNILEYSTWEDMESYVDRTMKEKKELS